ncbi:Serine/threonine protein phosphatase 7 long form isogeny [Arachis hypogaea]|nr:Serine/threonine protein phosphatase 7 long form isogeny [Arachis hypogaea]
MSESTDVAIILGLLTDGLTVTRMTMSSFEALEAKCLHNFGVAPKVREVPHYVVDRNDLVWGQVCASRYECKEIHGPLTLLLGWAWICLPYLVPLPRKPRSFSLANRWRNWERGDRHYRYLTLAHFRKALDDLQEGQWIVIMSLLYLSQFVWVAYAVDRVDPDIIPPDIYMHSVLWSATVPLGVPHQERNLDKAHGEVLIGPKNLNWATATTHSFWVMPWTDMYNHILTELPMPGYLQVLVPTKFGDRLNLSNLVVQENDEGNQDMDVDNQEQEPQSPPPPPPPPNPLLQEQPMSSSQYLLGFMAADAGQSQYAQQPDYFMAGRYSLDAWHSCRTSSGASGGFVSVDSKNANTLEQETDGYLVDESDDEDEDEEDEIEESDEDEESRNDGEARTPDETGKGYNLRVDPPRRSASRYTSSMFKKAAKKCKNLVKDVKWAMKKIVVV